MERPYRITIAADPRWPWLQTALRTLFTLLLIWGFFSGSSPLSFGLVAVLALINAFALLFAYELAIRDLPTGWIAGGIFTLIVISLAAYGAWLVTRPPTPTGPLWPAREATPDASCVEKIGPKDLVMAFGFNRAIGTGSGPYSPFVVADCAVMTLHRVGQGLMVRAFFYDFNGDVAFSVMDNVYEPALPLQLRQFRPDPHTIVILDRFDKEVLYLRYLNPNAVRIRGRFLCGTAPQAIIRDDMILVGGVRISGAYFGQRLSKGHVCAAIKSGAPGIAVGRS
ncbi:MAG TPA: hypothetical protein VN175_03790 [Rhizomicrobium sp.]|nr:hypothetical protein [Rhizomicrobium sp.]